MSPHGHDPTLAEERRLAHTGLLAKLTGHFARHPWRTVATWYLWRSLDPLPVEY